MSLNTVISALVVYGTLNSFKLNRFQGLVAVLFAALYLFLGWLIARLAPQEARIPALFFLTGFAFTVLVIPLQFGM